MLSTQTYLPRRNQPSPHQNIQPSPFHTWSPSSPSSTITTTQSFDDLSTAIYSFGCQQDSLFDFHPQHLPVQVLPELMQSEQSNTWLSNGQLTPTSATTRARHYRESSLSSLGSTGPSSPFTFSTSNPQVALSTDPVDICYEMHDQSRYQSNSKPLTPAHTPSQEHFLASQYSRFNPQTFQAHFNQNHFNQVATITNDDLQRQQQQTMGDVELMPAPEFNHSGRPSVVSVASHDSPATPPAFDDERRKNADFRNTMPKLDRTMTDIYVDDLYNPSFQITSAPPPRSVQAPSTMSPSPHDIFNQRLQAAHNQHLSSMAQAPLSVPSRERSPFRHGSPLAPATTNFAVQKATGMRFGTAQGLREQRKAENDAMALQQQLGRNSPARAAPKTVSPKDVDLVYHENEEDTSMPLFPKQEQHSPQQFRQSTLRAQEQPEMDDCSSQQSFGSMATSRRESSAYSTSSQMTPQAAGFNFAAPALPSNMRAIPQQYPFISNARRQPNTMSGVAEDFPATLVSMESSSSEYTPDNEIKKPARTTADSGTYTCTYHNCTLRFETPAKLQRHKREGHRQVASALGGKEESDDALHNTQAGPHKCERINPSTGKPCNTIFSRPYDLTRHEDTIHNARKQKIRCNLCSEEKTFSRKDALNRHFRVVHPNEELPGSRMHRRRLAGNE